LVQTLDEHKVLVLMLCARRCDDKESHKFGNIKTEAYHIDLGFDQILDLVRQLPKKDKIRLSKELEGEIVDVKLTALLKAFKTDDLDQDTINKEVEIVRTELYAKSKAK
jgi:hypothetical protein